METGSPDEPVLARQDHDGVVTLCLNRPRQFNALSEELLDALQRELDSIAADASVRCVVIAAAGKAFCAGHDLRQMRATPTAEYYQALFARCSRVMQALQTVPVPVIARVQGLATAAGCQLVATCDLAVAADDARFATPGVKIGLFCSTPMVALSRAVGRKKALEMLYTGDWVSADEAVRIGLINRAVPPADLERETLALAERIAAASRHVVGIGKAAFYRQVGLAQEQAYAYATNVMALNALAHDAQEGMSAFLEKRQPTWENR